MIKIEGLDEMTAKLEELSNRASDLQGSHEVPLTELLTPGFLAGCSIFLSPDELFAASGFKVESTEDFAAIPDNEWDDFIQKNTSYETWNDMLSAASTEWTKANLGF
ncbi:MAG: hypothetical protein ABSB30_00015 [Terracidiphilus sp.]|jgi:hypothetical protein